MNAKITFIRAKGWLLFGLFVFILMSGGISKADQKDPKLDELFNALMETKLHSEANVIINTIWATWLRTEK